RSTRSGSARSTSARAPSPRCSSSGRSRRASRVRDAVKRRSSCGPRPRKEESAGHDPVVGCREEIRMSAPHRDGPLAAALEALKESLPFAPARLSEPQLMSLDRFLQSWCVDCGLGDEHSREVVRVYIEHCSPTDADPRSVEMAAEFLLWFFALNDIPDGIEKRTALSAVLSILRGEDATAPRFDAATRRFRDGIMHRYLHPRLRAAIEA